MPSRPVPSQDARVATKGLNLPAEYIEAINRLRGDQALSGWLWENAILPGLERETSYRETARRAAPVRRYGGDPAYANVALSPRALEAIDSARGGKTLTEWLREAVEERLLAEPGELPEIALRRLGGPPRKKRDEVAYAAARAAAAALQGAPGMARSETIRQLQARGLLSGLTQGDIAEITGLTKQRVSQVLKREARR